MRYSCMCVSLSTEKCVCHWTLIFVQNTLIGYIIDPSWQSLRIMPQLWVSKYQYMNIIKWFCIYVKWFQSNRLAFAIPWPNYVTLIISTIIVMHLYKTEGEVVVFKWVVLIYKKFKTEIWIKVSGHGDVQMHLLIGLSMVWIIVCHLSVVKPLSELKGIQCQIGCRGRNFPWHFNHRFFVCFLLHTCL